MSGAIALVGFAYIRNAYYDTFSEELKAAATMMEHEINNEWEGDWTLTDGGQLRKGNTSIHDSYQKQLDDLHRKPWFLPNDCPAHLP